MARNRPGSILCYLTVASLLCMAATVMVAVSYGTDYWQVITVDRDSFTPDICGTNPPTTHPCFSDYTYFSRNRGIFRVCVPGNETYFLEDTSNGLNIVDGKCIWDEGIDLPAQRSWGDDNEIREHLVRFHIALFALGLALFLIALLLGGFSCWAVSSSYMVGAGICTLLGSFTVVGGLAVFHGYLRLEMDITQGDIFAGTWASETPLVNYTEWEYGWSYAIAWAGAIVAILAAIFFLAAGFSLKRKNENEKDNMALVPAIAPQPIMKAPAPTRVVQVPTPVPVPVAVPRPVPVIRPYPVAVPYSTLPRQAPTSSLPVLAYPSLYPSLPNPRSPRGPRSTRSAFDTAVYQSQPPAYPSGNINFSSSNSAFM